MKIFSNSTKPAIFFSCLVFFAVSFLPAHRAEALCTADFYHTVESDYAGSWYIYTYENISNCISPGSNPVAAVTLAQTASPFSNLKITVYASPLIDFRNNPVIDFTSGLPRGFDFSVPGLDQPIKTASDATYSVGATTNVTSDGYIWLGYLKYNDPVWGPTGGKKSVQAFGYWGNYGFNVYNEFTGNYRCPSGEDKTFGPPNSVPDINGKYSCTSADVCFSKPIKDTFCYTRPYDATQPYGYYDSACVPKSFDSAQVIIPCASGPVTLPVTTSGPSNPNPVVPLNVLQVLGRKAGVPIINGVKIDQVSPQPPSVVPFGIPPPSPVTDFGGTTDYGRTTNQGFTVTLQAPPLDPAGAGFSSWSGCTSVSGRQCTITMTATGKIMQYRTVTANYTNAASVTLTGASPIAYGAISSFSWTSSGMSEGCTLTNNSAIPATSGLPAKRTNYPTPDYPGPNLSGDTTFTLTCNIANSPGMTASSSFIVKVLPRQPAVNPTTPSCDATGGKISLTYTGAGNASSYSLYRKLDTDASYTLVKSGTWSILPASDTGLLPGRTYSYRLDATNANGTTSSVIKSASASTVCVAGPPGVVRVTPTTGSCVPNALGATGRINLNFTQDPGGPTEWYELWRFPRTDQNSGWATPQTPNILQGFTSPDSSELIPGALYGYQVAAVYQGGAQRVWGPYKSATASVYCFDYLLFNNGNVTVTAGTSGSNSIATTLVHGPTQLIDLTLSSSPALPGGITGYWTSRSSVGVPSAVPVTFTVASSVTAGTYPITITGSPYSQPTFFDLIVLTPPPPAPSVTPATPSCAVSAGTAGQVQLSWPDVAGETGYRVYVSSPGGNLSTLPAPSYVLGANATNQLVSGLTSPGSLYDFKVSSFNAYGESLSSDIYATASVQCPDLTVESVTSQNVSRPGQPIINGDSVRFSAVVKNNGGATPTTFYNRFTLDSDSTILTPLTPPSLPGLAQAPAIASVVSFLWPASNITNVSVSHPLVVCADTSSQSSLSNKVEEKNIAADAELNNCKTLNFSVLPSLSTNLECRDPISGKYNSSYCIVNYEDAINLRWAVSGSPATCTATPGTDWSGNQVPQSYPVANNPLAVPSPTKPQLNFRLDCTR